MPLAPIGGVASRLTAPSRRNWKCTSLLFDALLALRDDVTCNSLCDGVLGVDAQVARAWSIKASLLNDAGPEAADLAMACRGRARLLGGEEGPSKRLRQVLGRKAERPAMRSCTLILPASSWGALVESLLDVQDYARAHAGSPDAPSVDSAAGLGWASPCPLRARSRRSRR